MPNPENFTPPRQVRIEEDLWRRLGELVGDRERSADLKKYIAWRVANPNAALPDAPASAEDVHDYFVRVRVRPGTPPKRRVEVIEVPNAQSRDKATGDEIAQAIADHFRAQTPEERRRPRRVR